MRSILPERSEFVTECDRSPPVSRWTDLEAGYVANTVCVPALRSRRLSLLLLFSTVRDSVSGEPSVTVP